MTLITIVNRDLFVLAPIIFEFKDKTEKHILIYDDLESDNAIKLKKWIESFSESVESIEIDEDSKKDLMAIKDRISSYSNLFLNATNSDLSLVVALSSFVLNSGGKVIAYDKFENSYNIIDIDGFSNHKIKYSMNIDEFISSLGYKIVEEKNKKSILEKKEYILELFDNIQLLFKIRDALKNGNLTLLADKYPKKIEALRGLDIIDKNHKLSKNIAILGVYFEDFIYLNLIKYDFNDIKVGAIIEFASDEESKVNNEFDILAIKENHIFTFECKLGSKSSVNPQEIIYKSDALLDYFGDDSKGVIINIHPNRENRYNFSQVIKYRAITNSILVYNGFNFGVKKFYKNISKFLGVNKRVFLLGGKDLEMKTIKKLLKKYNQDFLDSNLSWDSAKLSSYQKNLKENFLFYGVELIEDITTPQNYIKIDHHNEYQNRKSSLEQIANILKIKLNRRGELIALNDSGYIPAMENFGATEDEIEKIRKEDRKAQGVTQKDEELAIEAIDTAQDIDGVLLIYSKTKKFSPIIDRLYKKSRDILIYNESALTYYGKNIKKLVNYYQDLIDKNQAYYGGDFGFFGITTDEPQKYINKIIELTRM